MKKECKFLFIFFLIFQISFSQEYSKIVDTKIGSTGEGLACGYNFIGATYPFGMVQFTPTFFSAHKGFVITQLNGAGCSNLGDFPILPISGTIEKSPNDMNSYKKFEEAVNRFVHIKPVTFTSQDRLLVYFDLIYRGSETKNYHIFLSLFQRFTG